MTSASNRFLRSLRSAYLRSVAALLAMVAAVATSVVAAPPPLPERLSSGGYALLHTGTDRLLPGRTADTRPRRPASQAGSALDAKVGPNIRLGDDPANLPLQQRAQAEPHIARSFADTNLIVATFQEGRFADGGAVDCGYAISLDGGKSWARGLIPHLIESVDGGPFTRASDPVAAVDFQGRILLNTLAIRPGDSGLKGTIVLTKSNDGGRTFTKPLTVLTSMTDAVFLDKNWMAVNTFPGTPTAGRIVVTYTRFDTTDPNRQVTPIHVVRSDDAGESWSSSMAVSPPDCQGSQPVFLPDGSLAVVYWNFDGAAGNQMEIVYSADGGANFTAPKLISPVRLHSDPVARDGAFLPSATADRTHGAIYVTCQGLTPDNVPAVLFTKSRDRGATWTKPLRVNDTPGRRSVFNPAISVSPDGQHVTIVFYDKRNDFGVPTAQGRWVDLYLAESFDGGETWQPNLRLSSESTDLFLAPLAPSKRMVGDYLGVVPALNLETPGFAIWVDTRVGGPDPFAVAIGRTQGSTFAAWQKLAFAPSELLNLTVSSEAADPDKDGLPNLLEYALALAPRRADTAPVKLQVSPGRTSLALEKSAAAGDVEILWRESADLRSWSPAVPEAVATAIGHVPSLQRLEFGFDSAAPVGFFRPGAR